MRGTVMKVFTKATVFSVIHFVHGGLLAAGFLAAMLLGMVMNSTEGMQRSLLALGNIFIEQTTAPAFAAETALPVPDVRATVDYLSRRYRVAASAIEPLVLAAREAGEKTRLDPILLVAVMAVESGFNPIAESPMGAQGLMQVIPRFHQDKLDQVSGNSLLDPSVNIHVGALVLKECINRAGSLEAGLRRYAGGISDVDGNYAARILAEKQRIQSAAGRAIESGA